MKKKFVILMSTLAITASLVGCGSKEEATTTPETEATATPEETTTDAATPEDDAENEDELKDEATAEDDETVEDDATTEEPEATEEPSEDEEVAEPTATPEPTKTPEVTKAPEATKTPVATPAPTAKPVATPAPTAKPVATPAPTAKPVATPKPTTKPVATPAPTAKPVATPAPTPVATPEPTKAPEVSSLSASDIFAKTVAGIELPSTMEMDSTIIGDMYGIDTSILKSFKVVAPLMSAHITEIAVFEVKDASGIAAVKAGIEKRTGGMNPAHMYPSLQEAFEARKTVVRGNYVLFAMDSNVDTLVSNFTNATK